MIANAVKYLRWGNVNELENLAFAEFGLMRLTLLFQLNTELMKMYVTPLCSSSTFFLCVQLFQTS